MFLKWAAGHACNVSCDEAISILEPAKLVRVILAPNKPVDVRGNALADGDHRSRYIPDIGKERRC